MTSEDLRDKWAWLATENKLREDRSPAFRRPRLGQKGVGRFATEKLGGLLTLRTSVTGEPKVLQVRFDWISLRAGRNSASTSIKFNARIRKHLNLLTA